MLSVQKAEAKVSLIASTNSYFWLLYPRTWRTVWVVLSVALFKSSYKEK